MRVPAVEGGGWRAVTAVSTALGAGAALVGAFLPVDHEHLWVLVALVVAAVSARALGDGGPRSVVVLAALVLVSQPFLHLVGELSHRSVPLDHGGPGGLWLLIGHVALAAMLVGVLAAGDRAARALGATLRRLVRILVRALPPAGDVPRRGAIVEARDGVPQQRADAPPPLRRGPPSVPCLPRRVAHVR